MEFKITISAEDVEEYAKVYFKKHPKAHKMPIEHPYHPSINTWFVMRRPQMNALKQKWKDFSVWLVKKNGLENLKLESFSIKFITYMPTKRRIDPDNTVPKFILDGFVEGGFLMDDDSTHLLSLELSAGYDKFFPRTEIIVKERSDHGSSF